MESMMGLDKPARPRPKKAKKERPAGKKSSKPKGLLRSLRGSKKKSVENLLEGKEEAPRSAEVPRRAQSSGSAERRRKNPATRAVVEGMQRRETTVKKVVTKSTCSPEADPVLVSVEGLVQGMRRDVSALEPLWPTAALKRVLDAKQELLRFERTSHCGTGDAIKEWVSSPLLVSQTPSRHFHNTHRQAISLSPSPGCLSAIAPLTISCDPSLQTL